MTSIRPLSPALEKIAKKQLNEDPKRVPADLQALRDWLHKQPHLTAVKPPDQFLIAFLRGCKFSLERSKEKIDMFYTIKTLLPEFFSNRDPLDNKIQEILKSGVFLPVQQSKDNFPRVNLVRVGAFDPTQHNLADLLKVSMMITEIQMLEDDQFVVAGEEIIVDMKGVGFSVLSQWTPTLAKKIITCLEKALPIRMKRAHIVNTPTGFETAYNIMKMFLGDKLKQRFHVHNQNYKEMHKSVPKSFLPEEYDGETGSVDDLIEHWKTKVETYRDWFLKEIGSGSDESKRPEAPKTPSVMFGVEGSFRQLQVD